MIETDDKKIGSASRIFNILLVVVFIATILVNFYFLYVQKQYEFIIETACDPSIEECFERDCTNPDDCPPNELSNFKRYSLNAGDFPMCEQEDCASACENGIIECTQLECEEDPEWGETCVSPTEPQSPEAEPVSAEETQDE